MGKAKHDETLSTQLVPYDSRILKVLKPAKEYERGKHKDKLLPFSPLQPTSMPFQSTLCHHSHDASNIQEQKETLTIIVSLQCECITGTQKYLVFKHLQ